MFPGKQYLHGVEGCALHKSCYHNVYRKLFKHPIENHLADNFLRKAMQLTMNRLSSTQVNDVEVQGNSSAIMVAIMSFLAFAQNFIPE